MNKSRLFGVTCALLFGALVATAPVMAQVPTPAFIAVTWSDNSVHFLDAGLNDISSFPTGSTEPNGVATDGTLIYSGHFTTQEVIAYDQSGVEQFRWSAAIGGLQGMDLVGNELAITVGSAIQFHDPLTGNLLRSVPNAGGGTVEGLAFDGTLLWMLGGSILGVDPADGAVVATIPNAASGCGFGGTGLTASAPGELHLACTDGTWYQVSSVDGAVITSGNNGLNMFGLKAASGILFPSLATTPVPTLGTAGLVLLIMLFAGLAVLRRRWHRPL